MAEIRLENVSYVYGKDTPFEKVALDSINLTFTPNRITGIIGHTGSGKSTLAQLLNGILRPTDGKILLDGEDLFSDSKSRVRSRFRVGLVFQYPEYQLFEETVRQDISFGPRNMKKSEDEIRALVDEAAHFTGIGQELMDRSPFELSGGQKRRVAIAGVLAMDPEVIVLDEPAAGLDPGGREEILGRLRAYQRSKNKTVILISHSMEDIARYADELLVLKNGCIQAHGSVDEVFSDRKNFEGTGLSLPQITRLILELRDRGIPLSASIHTVPDALFEIQRLLKGGV
ncbi:MAG: energy-coupling factor transporter ATPase [Clostridia bacterium]|nr:energy-coupling factor transporter ATPase [Clostridia bacterium]